MKRPLVLLLCAPLLVLAACGSEEAGDDDPAGDAASETAPTEETTSTDTTSTDTPSTDTPSTDTPATDTAPTGGDDICKVITDEAATEWAGTPQEVSEAQDAGYRTTCHTIVGADDGLGLEWSFQEADGSLAEMAELEADPSLDRQDVRLTGGVPAVRFESEDYVGAPYAKVVTIVDRQLLVVEARETPIGDEPITLASLRTIAGQVADAYAAS